MYQAISVPTMPLERRPAPGWRPDAVYHTKRRLKKTVALSKTLYASIVPIRFQPFRHTGWVIQGVKKLHSVQKLSLDAMPHVARFFSS